MMNNIENGLGYSGIGDKSSNSKFFPSIDLLQNLAEIKYRIVNQEVSNDLKVKE